MSVSSTHKPTSFLWNRCEHSRPRWGATECGGVSFRSSLFKTFNLKMNVKWEWIATTLWTEMDWSNRLRWGISLIINIFDTLWRCQAWTCFYASLKAPKKLKITMSWDQQTKTCNLSQNRQNATCLIKRLLSKTIMFYRKLLFQPPTAIIIY